MTRKLHNNFDEIFIIIFIRFLFERTFKSSPPGLCWDVEMLLLVFFKKYSVWHSYNAKMSVFIILNILCINDTPDSKWSQYIFDISNLNFYE